MKKITLFVSVMVFCFAFTAFAQEYKVGDKMPNYKLGTFLEGEKLLTNPADGPGCQIFFQKYSLRNSDSSDTEYFVAFPCSDSKRLPYGIFHGPTKTLYLDNNKEETVGNGPDGLIDEIILNPIERDMMADHPYCKK